MPAESNNRPPGQYLGVAPVTFDSAGKAMIDRSTLRFAPEFGGVGGQAMFGSLPEGNYQGDYAHGFGSLPEGNYQGDYAHGFGEGGDKVWSNIQRVGLGADRPVVRRIQPSDLKITPPLNKVVDYGDAVYVRVIADNVKDAADKAALSFTAVDVLEPYAVIPCSRRKGVFHVKAAKMNPDASMGRRGSRGGGGGRGRRVSRGSKASTGGNKLLSPAQVHRYLRGKLVRISRRSDRISVYGIAPGRVAALGVAKRAARAAKIKGANFVNAVPLGVVLGPPGSPPGMKLWQVNGRVGSAGKAKKESEAEVKEQGRTIADTAAKIAISPMVEIFDAIDEINQGYAPEDDVMQEDLDEVADEDYVEARYNAAVQALMNDSFGGDSDGSYTNEAFDGIPMTDDDGSYMNEAFGGSCGCR